MFSMNFTEWVKLYLESWHAASEMLDEGPPICHQASSDEGAEPVLPTFHVAGVDLYFGGTSTFKACEVFVGEYKQVLTHLPLQIPL